MTKLCPRGKAAAKRKFAVYPSAYANAYASKICAGKIKDPSGTKRKDFKGPKPAGKAAGGVAKVGSKFLKRRLKLSGSAGLGSVLGAAAAKILQKKKKTKKVQKKMMGGMTAGSQSAMGRLQKAKMMSGGFGIFSKGKKRKEFKKSDVEKPGNVEKKKKRLNELRKEIGAQDGVFVERPRPPRRTKRPNNRTRRDTDYLKKAKAYDVLTDRDRKRKIEKMYQKRMPRYRDGGMARGGGAAIKGTDFKGVF